MEFFVTFYGIIPSNPLASLAMTRQTRNHGDSFSGKCDVMRVKDSPLSEIARLLVRFDHVAGIARSGGFFTSCSTNASTSLLIRLSSSDSAPKISSTRSCVFLAFFCNPKENHLLPGSLGRVGIEFAVEMFLKRGKRPSVVSGFQRPGYCRQPSNPTT